MKLGFIGAVAVVCGIVAVSSDAQARTCKQLASNCVKNGGLQGECHADWRIAECNKTGMYTAPSGRVWNLKAKCVGGDCASYKGR